MQIRDKLFNQENNRALDISHARRATYLATISHENQARCHKFIERVTVFFWNISHYTQSKSDLFFLSLLPLTMKSNIFVKPVIMELGNYPSDDAVTILEIVSERMKANKSYHCSFFNFQDLKSEFMKSESSADSVSIISPSLSFYGTEWQTKKFNSKFTIILPNPNSECIRLLHPNPTQLKQNILTFISTNSNIQNADILLSNLSFHHGLFKMEHDLYTDLFIVDYFYKKSSLNSPIQWIRVYNTGDSPTSNHLVKLLEYYNDEYTQIAHECLRPIRTSHMDRFQSYSDLLDFCPAEHRQSLHEADLEIQRFLTSDLLKTFKNHQLSYIIPVIVNSRPVICVALKDISLLAELHLYYYKICIISDAFVKLKRHHSGCTPFNSTHHVDIHPGCQIEIKTDSSINIASVGMIVEFNNSKWIVTAGHALTNTLGSEQGVKVTITHGQPLENKVINRHYKHPQTAPSPMYHMQSFNTIANYVHEIEMIQGHLKWKDVAYIKVPDTVSCTNTLLGETSSINAAAAGLIKECDYGVLGYKSHHPLIFHSNVYICNWLNNNITTEICFKYSDKRLQNVHGDSGNIICMGQDDLTGIALFMGIINGFAIGSLLKQVLNADYKLP
eukprot:NODE_10_length_47437_cov_0.363429.p6 type:complete len:616 gc:universal NODE_10_length_47437_cov_0.363429:30450-28603(-)